MSRVAEVELDAAGVAAPGLRAAYLDCRALAARHGRTYFLATRLLPAAKRPHVHALYALARLADDIVDLAADPARAAPRLAEVEAAFLAGGGGLPIAAAARHTAERLQLHDALFTAFFASMRADLEVTSYADDEALDSYVYGSAEVIGLQLLPLLEPATGLAEVAATYARELGRAFQLTNFIRDVGEDLDRGRIYLPLDHLAAFDLTPDDMHERIVDGRVRRLLAFEIATTRELFRSAAHGIRLLHPASRDCVRTAWRLYGEILDAVEDADYQVLDRRVSVGPGRRATVFVPALARAVRARRPHQTHHARV